MANGFPCVAVSYDPKLFDPGLAEGPEVLDLEKEILAWEEAFDPQKLAERRHDAAASDFDASVWNLNIKHDTTVLGPNTEVHILMRFRTFEGPFVFHCHNLDHEDMRMMYQMDPRQGLACPDEQLKVRHDYWYFKDPTGQEHCCDKAKGELA
ncbi:MAG: multicopper oxidase domain-containing protein [Planctomycetaceae bacterium]